MGFLSRANKKGTKVTGLLGGLTLQANVQTYYAKKAMLSEENNSQLLPKNAIKLRSEIGSIGQEFQINRNRYSILSTRF